MSCRWPDPPVTEDRTGADPPHGGRPGVPAGHLAGRRPGHRRRFLRDGPDEFPLDPRDPADESVPRPES